MTFADKNWEQRRLSSSQQRGLPTHMSVTARILAKCWLAEEASRSQKRSNRIGNTRICDIQKKAHTHKSMSNDHAATQIKNVQRFPPDETEV